jgi:hypothetical protein
LVSLRSGHILTILGLAQLHQDCFTESINFLPRLAQQNNAIALHHVWRKLLEMGFDFCHQA